MEIEQNRRKNRTERLSKDFVLQLLKRQKKSGINLKTFVRLNIVFKNEKELNNLYSLIWIASKQIKD